jgi:hypothetical protein
MRAILTVTISALMLSGCATKALIYASRPTGDGDPNAISCYSGIDNTSRIKHKQCKSNAQWARVEAGIRSQATDGSFVPSLTPTTTNLGQ